MPKHNESEIVGISTLRLMGEDVSNAAKQIERHLQLAEQFGVKELDMKFLKSVETAIKRVNSFGLEIKEAIYVAVKASENERMLAEGDEQAAAAAARLKAKSKKADPTINPKTGRPFAK